MIGRDLCLGHDRFAAPSFIPDLRPIHPVHRVAPILPPLGGEHSPRAPDDPTQDRRARLREAVPIGTLAPAPVQRSPERGTRGASGHPAVGPSGTGRATEQHACWKTHLRLVSPVRCNGRVQSRVGGESEMVRIEGEIVIDRPVEEVFDFVADERNEPRYNPRLRRAEQISAGPIGPGTRFRAETTTLGRPVPMVIELTTCERPRRLASETHLSTMDIHGTLTFDPIPGGTRMRWSWELKPRGVFRLLTPIVARMGRRQEQTIWASLKRFLEAQATAEMLATDLRR